MHRSSSGDPARTIALLWRGDAAVRARPGPKPSLTVDDVVDTAISIADAEGLDAVSMRRLAAELGVSAMALYAYVPAKAELIDLMLDAAYLAMPRPPWSARSRWRSRLRAVAEANAELLAMHPWMAGVSTARPPLGPGQLAKYDHELGALDGAGLGDVETDAALTFVLGFVQAAALAKLAAGGGDDAAWWAVAGPELARHADPAQFPRASRVGSAAGAAQNAAFDPDRAFRFGLERVLDGLAALIAARA